MASSQPEPATSGRELKMEDTSQQTIMFVVETLELLSGLDYRRWLLSVNCYTALAQYMI